MTKLDTRWMFTIPGVKEVINNENLTDKEIALHVSKRLLKEVKRVSKNLAHSKPFPEIEMEYLLGELESVIHESEYIKLLASDEIPESEWEEYGFDGDWGEMLDYTLSTLYDIGDMKPIDNHGVKRKLLWVD